MFQSFCPCRVALSLFSVAVVLWSGAVFAADIVLVEETWELHVVSTDSNSTAQHVATALSPHGDVYVVHGVFELNHQSVPSWAPGGMHVQLWEGETPLETRKHPKGAVMSSGAEVVTWKQTMRLDGETLTFEVTDGTSETWGSFGGQGYLRSSTSTSLANLNGYDPDVSVNNSGVTYAGNRVSKLVLKQVRVVGSEGQQYVDTTERVAHEN